MKIRRGYIETAVHLLIAFGGVRVHGDGDAWHDGDVDYYGGYVNVDVELTRMALDAIRRDGINYEECSDPAEGSAPKFADTFTSTRYNVPYLDGTIVTNGEGRERERWLTQIDMGHSFSGLLGILTKYEITLDWALDRCQTRLAKDQSSFPFMCTITDRDFKFEAKLR